MKKAIFAIMLLILATAAAAFEIKEPDDRTYTTKHIDFEVEHSEELDRITYAIDDTSYVTACYNCSEYEAVFILGEGDHTIHAKGYLDNEVFHETVDFEVDLADSDDFSISIVSPEEKEYSDNRIKLVIDSDRTLDSISYKIDDGSYVKACEDCSDFSKYIDLTDGEHEIRVKGVLDGDTKTDDVDVTIDEESDFKLEIVKPTGTYEEGIIPIRIESDEELDKITVKISDIYSESCSDCDEFRGSVNLTEGVYTLRVTGKLDGEEKEGSVRIRVTEDDTDDEWEFGDNFKNLPELLKEGDISDEELADIIRNNWINPSVLKELIQTGKLGEESIDAILDTKYRPYGIIKRIFLYVGLGDESYSEMIYHHYNLSTKLKNKLITRDDLPRGIAKQLEKNLNDSVKVKDWKEYKGKSLVIAKQDMPDDDDLEKKIKSKFPAWMRD